MATWLKESEVNRAPELREADWQLRQKMEGALTAYVERVTDLLGDAEDFDTKAMNDRIDSMFEWARSDIADTVTKVVALDRGRSGIA